MHKPHWPCNIGDTLNLEFALTTILHEKPPRRAWINTCYDNQTAVPDITQNAAVKHTQCHSCYHEGWPVLSVCFSGYITLVRNFSHLKKMENIKQEIIFEKNNKKREKEKIFTLPIRKTQNILPRHWNKSQIYIVNNMISMYPNLHVYIQDIFPVSCSFHSLLFHTWRVKLVGHCVLSLP